MPSRRILLSFLLGLLAVSVRAAPPSSLAPDEIFTGRIAAVASRAITVVVKQGDNMAFLIDEKCAITLDGKAVSLDKLAVGQRVKIAARDEGTDHIANRIDAVSIE